MLSLVPLGKEVGPWSNVAASQTLILTFGETIKRYKETSNTLGNFTMRTPQKTSKDHHSFREN